MATAYPTIIYGQGSRIDTNPRLIETPYGDGYQQVTADGINYLPRSGSIEHPLIDNSVAATLLAFLRANSGGQIVTIVNYMEDATGSTTLNVRIKNWSKQQDGITNTYTVNFVEAFGS